MEEEEDEDDDDDDGDDDDDKLCQTERIFTTYTPLIKTNELATVWNTL